MNMDGISYQHAAGGKKQDDENPTQQKATLKSQLKCSRTAINIIVRQTGHGKNILRLWHGKQAPHGDKPLS